MRGGLYVYGIYWKNQKGNAVYADQSISPNPNLYQAGQSLGGAKVTEVVTGASLQDAGFDYIVFIEHTKEEDVDDKAKDGLASK